MASSNPEETRVRVCIIIPSLQRPDLVEHCLASLSKLTYPREQLEVILIENAAPSQPPPLDFRGLTVRRILQRTNLGTTGSINQGASRTDSRHVLLLNDDVELEPAFLGLLTRALDENENLGFATAKLLNARFRQRLDGAGDAMLLGGGAYRLGHGDVDHGQFDEARPVLAGCGAAMLIRRSVFEELGGLDEKFFAYLDDVDLCVRAHLAGYRGIYVPAAVGYHVGSATLGGTVHPKIVSWMTRNQISLLLKNYPLRVLLRLLPRIVVYQLLWFLLSLKRGTTLAYIAGMAGAASLLVPILRERRLIMKSKKLSNAQFLALLRQSEQQIFDWHKARTATGRSSLLHIYFRLFPPK